MQSYFSFDRFITKGFVKVVYLLGFVALTMGGLGLAVWSGLRLQNASISRQAGWRYVAIGVGALIVGNLVWRVFCEVWVVLFNMHARLVAIDRALHTTHSQTLPLLEKEMESSAHSVHSDEVVEPVVLPKERFDSLHDSRRQNSVLGLT